MSIKTACFTGHRHLLQHKVDELSQLIDQAVVEAYKHGYRQFLCGGALGFDTLAASRLFWLFPAKTRIYTGTRRTRYYIGKSGDRLMM